MITKEEIISLAEAHLEGSDNFIVDIRLSSTNKITVLIDNMKGIRIEDCVSMSRHIEHSLDREKQDFELMVSSPGLEMPFLITKQYFKNEGRNIEVVDKQGKKLTGILKNVTEGGFELETAIKVKGKKSTPATISYNYDEIASARVSIKFK